MSLGVPVAAALIGADGRYVGVSPGWARLYAGPGDGLHPSGWKGLGHIDTFRLHEHPSWLRAYRASQAGVESFRADIVTLPSGIAPQQVWWALIPIGDGRVLCVVIDPVAAVGALARLTADLEGGADAAR